MRGNGHSIYRTKPTIVAYTRTPDYGKLTSLLLEREGIPKGCYATG